MKLFIILKDNHLIKKKTKKIIKLVLNFLKHLEYRKVSSF